MNEASQNFEWLPVAFIIVRHAERFPALPVILGNRHSFSIPVQFNAL